MSWIKRLRAYELHLATSDLEPGSVILELGAGSGWQARLLSQRGFKVSAIDLETSPYGAHREFPVQNYDGARLPFPDREFDIVFSSNVLEHVRDVNPLLAEMARVLKSNGMAIHLMPTSSWRMWTSVAHYFFIIKYIMLVVRGGDLPHPGDSGGQKKKSITWLRWLRLLLPVRHGERGNFVTESMHFSRNNWLGIFKRSGWKVIKCRDVGIFYTGYSILGLGLSLRSRSVASRILGDSCRAYFVKPRGR